MFSGGRLEVQDILLPDIRDQPMFLVAPYLVKVG